jgi:signal transduction histidine kinase
VNALPKVSQRASQSLVAHYRARTFILIVFVSSLVTIFSISVATLQIAKEVASRQIAQVDSAAGRLQDFVDGLHLAFGSAAARAGITTDASEVVDEFRRLLAQELSLQRLDVVDTQVNLRFLFNRSISDNVEASRETPPPITPRARLELGELVSAPNQSPGVSFKYFPTGEARFKVTGELNLQRVSDLLSRMSRDSGLSVNISNSSGYVIAQPSMFETILQPRSIVYVEGTLWNAVADLMFGQREAGLRLIHGRNGAVAMFASKRLQLVNWSVNVERPLWDSIASIRGMLLIVLAIFTLSLFAAYTVGAYVAKRLATPTMMLRDYALKIPDRLSSTSPREIDSAMSGELLQLAETLQLVNLKLVRTIDGMEETIDERTRDLAQLNGDLQRSNAYKRDFLAHMSHELRTPLNAVIGFSEMLDARYFGPLNDKQAEYVRDIHQSGQHLLSLINDILDLAKIESGRVELAGSLMDIAALVESCRALTSERFHRKRQTLEIRLELDQSHWFLDARKIKQCIINLLSNANKFTAEEKRVVLSVSTSASSLTVVVKDEGIGIPSDALPRLFSEFFQVTESTGNGENVSTPNDANWRPDGTGLGLSLTKRFIELHGGTITVRSVVNVGSEFVIVIPKINPTRQPTSI